jgi:hypothetical protein
VSAGQRKRAKVDFHMTRSAATGEFSGYHGRLVNCESSERFVDQQDDRNVHAEHTIRIKPVPGSVTQYALMTQGAGKGGRRYRYGTLEEMIEAAEKWAARRFYVEPIGGDK